MSQTVEDAINVLLAARITTMPHCGDPPRLKEKDRKLLSNMRYKNTNGYTSKQRNYILSILSKYLLLLKSLKWPIDDLLNPVWSSPPLPEIVRTKYSISFLSESNTFVITIPFDRTLIEKLHSFADSKNFFDLLRYNTNSKSWYVVNGEQGKKLVKWLMKYNKEFIVGDEVIEQINEIEDLTPHISFLNNEWKLFNGAPSLQQVVNNILTNDMLTPVQTAFELSSCYVKFDHTVKNYLKNWLTTTQIRILCEEDVIIKCVQMQELINLMLLTDKWPVLAIHNRFDDTLKTPLDTINWPKYPITGTSLIKEEDLKKPLLLVDVENKYVKSKLNLPWVVRYSSSVITQNIFMRYNKLVEVEKD
jgi:hypothetical protein